MTVSVPLVDVDSTLPFGEGALLVPEQKVECVKVL